MSKAPLKLRAAHPRLILASIGIYALVLGFLAIIAWR